MKAVRGDQNGSMENLLKNDVAKHFNRKHQLSFRQLLQLSWRCFRSLFVFSGMLLISCFFFLSYVNYKNLELLALVIVNSQSTKWRITFLVFLKFLRTL